jgi:hypothetical protein
MPYIPAGRRQGVSLLAGLAAAFAAVALGAGTAQAQNLAGPATTPDVTQCQPPSLSQAFLGSGDFNYYAAAPGPSNAGFDGSTWTLTGGANITSTQLADGSTGPVLDLPAGSMAVSPAVCVSPAASPMLRAWVRSLNGGDGVSVSVSYYTPGGWTNPQGAGSLQGQNTSWSASGAQNLPNPPGGSNQTGWQVVRFFLVPGGGHTEFDVYGLNVSALPPPPSTGPCTDPTLTQAFAPMGDANYYTQAPDFSAWTLAGGARVKSTTLADGSTGQVLDLPAGSMAVSPNICVTSLYPTARMMIRSLFGGDDLSFRVSYGNTNTWTNPHETGHVHGNNSNWTTSDSVQLQPGNGAGWQIVRLALVPNGGHSEFQIYDLQLDPYAKG